MDEPLTLKKVLEQLDGAVRPDVVRYVERMAETIRFATAEIDRLNNVIDKHVSSASGHLIANYKVEPITQLDINGMRTYVRSQPVLTDFYLAEPLSGWSEDHRRAFHKQVVRGFSENNAEAIAKSIWSVRP